MRSLIAMCIFVLAIQLTAQINPQTFTSPNGDFQFKFSPALIHCTRGSYRLGAELGWIEDSCLSQGDLCDDDSTKGTTIICLAYPHDQFKDKPAFVAAAFFAESVPAATTQKVCLEASQDWLVEDSHATKNSGISATLFHTSDAWTSHSQSGEIYRVFHADKCYELGIQDVESNTGGYDPGTFKEYTEQDAVKVRASLRQPLKSFKFLK